ncbi:tryptophan--tRNA ligase [Kibdelosporangium philippinense]|uniref:Tryptophan--tRNA ligase n=1 Tax=Kibdelosporangium philippinense TaxID=211113 RepID=A0ABS8ZLX7_9PSEU|nr:tryptophan--tRNA ligase [Kibdelosporangium philippinense]MCE7008514.1 tryptophan--tRNA ligase [Kibdelosporangium philippinense]
MTRLSAVTPSGHAQLGNYLGAIRRWACEGAPDDLYFVSDMHAMTTAYNPQRLRALSREMLAILIGSGIKPESVFVQSDIAAQLSTLSWVLECTCTFGEVARMIQFKEKSAGAKTVRLGLLTYPVLMASDILLPGADEVPVGDDQAQHVELARALARRFNTTYGEAFVVPQAVTPKVAARIRDLADPDRKMAKSTRNETGVVFVLEDADMIRRKFQRAVTDTAGRVEYRPDEQPGVANLLEILSACTGQSPKTAAEGIGSYRELKETVADAVIEELRDVRKRTQDLLADPAELDRIRATGAERAAQRGEHRLSSVLRLAGIA